MKLKTLAPSYLLIATALLTAASVFANPMIPEASHLNVLNLEPVDFKKVNPLLQELTNQILIDETQVKFAYPEFDTELSSLQNERIVYSMKGKIENTLWGSDAQATGLSDYQIDRTSSITGISVKYFTKTETDVIKLLNFAAFQVLVKATNFVADYPKHAPLLIRGKNAKNMAEIYSFLKDAQIQSITETNDEISHYNKDIDCLYTFECGKPVIDAWGNRKVDDFALYSRKLGIEELSRLRASFESTTITFNEELQEITILSPSPQGFLARTGNNHTESKFSKVMLTEDHIIAEGSLFIPLSNEKLDSKRDGLVSHLNGLIENDAARVTDIQEQFRRALIKIKKVINAEILN